MLLQIYMVILLGNIIVEQQRRQVDRFVFLGDYFDSKLLDISPQNEVENFKR